jgi:hypothetical protein
MQPLTGCGSRSVTAYLSAVWGCSVTRHSPVTSSLCFFVRGCLERRKCSRGGLNEFPLTTGYGRSNCGQGEVTDVEEMQTDGMSRCSLCVVSGRVPIDDDAIRKTEAPFAWREKRRDGGLRHRPFSETDWLRNGLRARSDTPALPGRSPIRSAYRSSGPWPSGRPRRESC